MQTQDTAQGQSTRTVLDLLERYNRPGPRYTSYPPAVHFTTQVSPAALLPHMAAEGGALSLYFHLPFCESLCWFCGCNTITTRSHNRADEYLDLLEREVALTVPYLNGGVPQPEAVEAVASESAPATAIASSPAPAADSPAENVCVCRRPVAQLHFGGGTPNFLSVAQIDRLAAIIRRHFHFAQDAELSVELDPRRLSKGQVQAFARMGMRRASFGVQDCNPQVQAAINRRQSLEVSRNAMRWLRDAGFDSVNVDLVYGLPHQSVESFSRTLDEVLELEPDRLAVFGYAHVPWIRPAQKLLERGSALPSPRLRLELLALVRERLCAAGYVSIGMDHFARPQDELCLAQRGGTLQRNFQGYSTRADCSIVGFGVSSISQTAFSYRQNFKEIEHYREKILAGELPLERGYLMSAEDARRRTVIMRLMCDLRIDYRAMGEALGVDFREHFQDCLTALAPLEADGLVRLCSQALEVTEAGRWFIRNIAMCFDAYMPAAPAAATAASASGTTGGTAGADAGNGADKETGAAASAAGVSSLGGASADGAFAGEIAPGASSADASCAGTSEAAAPAAGGVGQPAGAPGSSGAVVPPPSSPPANPGGRRYSQTV